MCNSPFSLAYQSNIRKSFLRNKSLHVCKTIITVFFLSAFIFRLHSNESNDLILNLNKARVSSHTVPHELNI